MDFLHERISNEVYERSLLVLELKDRKKKDVSKLADLAHQRFLECKLLARENPENEILQHNLEMLLLICLVFEMSWSS